MSCLWFAYTCIMTLGRSLNSYVSIYEQFRVLHTSCVTTKKWQFISISFCCNEYMQSYLCTRMLTVLYEDIVCVGFCYMYYILL